MRIVRTWLTTALHQLDFAIRSVFKHGLIVLISGVLIVATVWDAQAVSHDQLRAQQARREAAQQAALAQSRAAGHGLNETGLDSVNAQQSGTQDQQSTGNTPTPTSAPIKYKYSTSPDPRSTDYSYTPPVPNQADFITAITHNGQVAPGTLIGYNAEKYGMHSYYGGDLVFTVPSVSISKSSASTSAPFTVSIPGGAVSRAPSMPWNDQSSAVFPAYSTAPSDGTSWTMFIQLSGSPAPSTTPYTVHLQTFRSNTGNDEWEYDGFLQVYVNP